VYATRYGLPLDFGVVLPVRLGHQQLADLVGSQRPSVSAHLGELARRGEVLRRADRTWLLRGSPPTDLADLRVRAPRDLRAAGGSRSGGFDVPDVASGVPTV
jgi:hypothetical protein